MRDSVYGNVMLLKAFGLIWFLITFVSACSIMVTLLARLVRRHHGLPFGDQRFGSDPYFTLIFAQRVDRSSDSRLLQMVDCDG